MTPKRTRYTGASGADIGAYNLDRVRRFFTEHLGVTNIECSKALGLSPSCLSRHIKALRKEWGG